MLDRVPPEKLKEFSKVVKETSEYRQYWVPLSAGQEEMWGRPAHRTVAVAVPKNLKEDKDKPLPWVLTWDFADPDGSQLFSPRQAPRLLSGELDGEELGDMERKWGKGFNIDTEKPSYSNMGLVEQASDGAAIPPKN